MDEAAVLSQGREYLRANPGATDDQLYGFLYDRFVRGQDTLGRSLAQTGSFGESGLLAAVVYAPFVLVRRVFRRGRERPEEANLRRAVAQLRAVTVAVPTSDAEPG